MSATLHSHWARQRERGSLWLMRALVWAVNRLGRPLLAPVVWAVVAYFYLTGQQARHSIAAYQRRLKDHAPNVVLPARWPVYRHYLAFATALLDKLDVWRGRIRLKDVALFDPDGVHPSMSTGAGQMLVGSHLGNIEICRALAERERDFVLNVLVHNKHAQAFNQLLGEAGAERLRLIQVSELDAPTMLQLADALARGEWLAIAGDRVPLSGERVVEVDFLGDRADFPQGPWLLAGLLGCPVNVLHCTRQAGRYHIELARLADRVEWTRSTRASVIAHWAQRYADELGQACARAPLQWFNFYPFWKNDAQPRNS